MASADSVWNDFDAIRHSIPRNTVDRLKQILVGLNERNIAHLSKAGNKQAIIDRITSALDGFKVSRATDKWIIAKSVVQSVRYPGALAASTSAPIITPSPVPPPTFSTASTTIKSPSFSSAGPSTSIGRYDPYAPPRKPAAAAVSTGAATSSKPGVRFKESPFFHVQQSVSGMIECPESSSATDRRSQVFTFTLTNEQVLKLKSNSPKYQLRLFCTSSAFYSPNITSFRPTVGPCLVEFPPTCEVRVNNVQVNANLKGLKKKPGTAPPPDLGKYVRTGTSPNRVEMIYVNSQQPALPKKFYMMVQLVEVVNVDTLVQDLVKKGYKSSHDIRNEMIAAMTVDDDIVAGSQKMSLKCPLSYMRVNTPCRSRKCAHSQCFDATSWFSVMEQTTTWLCPVCERILDPADLIIDGYFDEILKSSPDSVEDVVVEADGEWHTSDNKYGSAAWKAAHAPISKPASPLKVVAKSPSKPVNGDPNGKRKATEIVILDSDDEDEGRVKRELSPSFASSSSASRSFESVAIRRSQPEVIDLTLDSDEEAPPSRPVGKRTATEAGISPTESIWKKGRMEAIIPSAVRPPSTEYSRTGVVPLLSSRTLPPPPVGYQGPVLPPVYNIPNSSSAYRWP
ncbi:PINIT domain-containing protein [Mycena amicta]|nr:PINIT domain-containing protein [Mycena amicta]